jgi:hypothetical protein
MLRIRYMLVDHSKATAQQWRMENNTFVNTALPHAMMPVCHWQRLDDATVLLKGFYNNRHHATLIAMTGVTVLPATHSRKTVASAIDEQHNQHHHDVLNRHGMPYDAHMTTSDLVDWAAVHIHEIFDHEV